MKRASFVQVGNVFTMTYHGAFDGRDALRSARQESQSYHLDPGPMAVNTEWSVAFEMHSLRADIRLVEN